MELRLEAPLTAGTERFSARHTKKIGSVFK
jgi:hypothetical protein